MIARKSVASYVFPVFFGQRYRWLIKPFWGQKMSRNNPFRHFFVACPSPLSYKGIGTRRACDTNAPLTKAPIRRRHWLTLSLHVRAKDANQTRSLLSVARSWNESKSQQWTTIAQSGLCSKTEPISGSMLNRSFASRPITQTGKLTTTNASNAGQLSGQNNPLCIINHEPACNGRVFLLSGGVL